MCPQAARGAQHHPNLWGSPSSFTNYLESFSKSLLRIVSRDWIFGLTFGNWVQSRLSNPSVEHMTCLTKDNFVPTKKPDVMYTIRMYTLKVYPNFLVNGCGPKHSMQGGYDKSAFTSDTEKYTAGWKYFGTIAPKTASVMSHNMLKALLNQAADEHKASHNSPVQPTFVLGPNGRITDCYDTNNQRAQSCTCTLATNSSCTFSCPAGDS